MRLNYSLVLTAAAASFSPITFAVNPPECFDEGTPFHPTDWKHCQPISDELFLYYTPMDDTVMLGLHATKGVFGWSSLGPAGNGGMKGASQIIVRQDDDGKWIAEDRHSFDYVPPTMDEHQDVQLVFAQQDDVTGETSWGVIIPQNSCDEPFDYEVEDRNMFLIWAYGTSHAFSFHGENRGQFTANLLGAPKEAVNMDDYGHIDIIMPNVPVVRGEEDLDPTNPFICSYFDMEELGKEMDFSSGDKVHIVGYEPVINEGNEKILHHFVLFSCEGFPTQEGGFSGLDDTNLKHQQVIPACTSMPPGCSEFVAGWAVGAPAIVLPENVGFPIGEGKRWLVLQTHYYNPTLKEDVYDSSGLRVHVTKDVRPIDAGVMQFVVGTTTGQHQPLPGGQKDVAMETLYAEPGCTQQWTEPLTVIAVNHHSHFKGLQQSISVERDGKNLGPMRKEYRFDYNHQSNVPPMKAMETLLPGDRLSASCRFDTSSVSSDSQVQIGEESNKEMCFPTLFYYPKQELNTFMYYDLQAISNLYIGNTEWCSLAPTDDAFESMCVEKLYTEASNFYGSLLPTYDGPAFGYADICNGGELTAGMRDAVEGYLWLTKESVCPADCVETQSCTEEAMKEHAKLICIENCNIMGLSVYPDESRSTPYDTINVNCPQPLFHAPTIAEPAVCEMKGALPQDITLTDFEDNEEVPTKDEEVPTKDEVPTEDEEVAAEDEKNGGTAEKTSGFFAVLLGFAVLLIA